MKRFSTPNFDPKKIILKNKSTLPHKAPKSLVATIMTYVNCTKSLESTQIGNVKLFLN